MKANVSRRPVVRIVPKRNPKTTERLVNSMCTTACFDRIIFDTVVVVVVIVVPVAVATRSVRVSRQYLSVPYVDRVKSKQT